MDIDDKITVIVCVTAIALSLIWTRSDMAAAITSNIISGLFGVAVGRQK